MSLIWGLRQLSAWPATLSLGSGCQTPSHPLESQLAGGRAGYQKKRYSVFMVACMILDFHSWLNLLIAVFVPFLLFSDLSG